MTSQKQSIFPARRAGERGNVLFMILMAIVLIGLLTAAIQFTNRPEGANIDREQLLIRVGEVQRYASELERAVLFIVQENGKSESDIRFAHPEADADYGDLAADTDKKDQVFAREGGAAVYRTPPQGIQVTAAPWEFYGGTHMPQVGSSRPDLIAVLPNVTLQFCQKINEMNGLTGMPTDTGASAAAGSSAGDCLNVGALGRFDDGQQFYDPPGDTPNTTNEASFSRKPALQACVQCALDGQYHFYHVLLAR